MGTKLRAEDDLLRTPGTEPNWNESRYLDLYDPAAGIGGWFRTGNRPNAGYAEMSACVYLPGGQVGFQFARPKIDRNVDAAGGLAWRIDRPFERSHMHYAGELAILDDPFALVNPKAAFAAAPRVPASVELEIRAFGIGSVLGQDQDQIGRIFLPGQADGHFQHLVHCAGEIRVGDQRWAVNARGGRDHSWGPRNWNSKIWFRWLVGVVDDDFGFMATRALGPTAARQGGFVWENGTFHEIDAVEVRSDYMPDKPYHVASHAQFRSGARTWRADGRTLSYVPLRHARKHDDGREELLRIVKSPMRWALADGRTAWGITEYHDDMIDGRPAGLGI
ncbi:MAG: hypothetical protein AB7Q97_21855 [Gammaproteobacteria bacterium]